jgi:tetratricopeptide (TPR) repeat protein
MSTHRIFTTAGLKNKSFHLAIMAFLSVSLQASACINDSGTNRRGEQIKPMSHTGQSLKPYLVTLANHPGWTIQSGYAIENVQNRPGFDTLTDLAAVLIRLKRPAAAVRLLQFIERKYPGHYQTAANIGTAYELMGRNEDALKWILEGVKRNPGDHYGTEWLHAHILKAKLGRLPEPAPGLSILNLDFGNDVMPHRPTRFPVGTAGKPLSLFEVGNSLRYQLIERIYFVAAPDAMVAGLLLDWANLELLAGAVESADVLYDAALRYGSKETRIIATRKTQVAKILAQARATPAKVNGRCELCELPDRN